MISMSSSWSNPSHFAAGARQEEGLAHQEFALQDDLGFSRPIEALLTDVVIRLRESWVAGPANCGGEICLVCELAGTDLDKRVSAALCKDFLEFAQFSCSFEVLMLQRVNGSPEFKEALLGVEQLFVHGPNYLHRLGFVPYRQGSFAEVNRAIDGADGTGDQRKIQTSSPNVEKGCVRTPDSTLRGNCDGEGGHERSPYPKDCLSLIARPLFDVPRGKNE